MLLITYGDVIIGKNFIFVDFIDLQSPANHSGTDTIYQTI